MDSFMDQDSAIAELQGAMDTLIEILVARGTLAEGHKRLFEKLREHSGRSTRSVRLASYADKYEVPDPKVPCAELLHLCRARCCSFAVTLSVQDLDEGGFEWAWQEPYVLRRDETGYCSKMTAGATGCTCYEQRPAICRRYDCRADKRVWLDYEARVPAPMPEGVSSRSCENPETS